LTDTAINTSLGATIRRLRKQKKMTLTELSRRVEVSKSLISQIERGLSNPSIPVLRSIARALEVPLFTLFVEDDYGNGIVRRHERQHLHMPGTPVVRELLVPDLHRRMILVHATFDPGVETSSAGYASHAGEECVVVLRGRIEIEIPSNTIVLECGDSFYFDSKLPHNFRNSGGEPAEIIAAISPVEPL
jgi:transcriptional regulator with XRE-family HTH domain